MEKQEMNSNHLHHWIMIERIKTGAVYRCECGNIRQIDYDTGYHPPSLGVKR